MSRKNPYYSGPQSDHFDGTLFFNPDGEAPQAFRELLRWQLGGGRARWPTSWPSPFAQAKPEDRLTGDRLVVTMVGHSTLLVQAAGLNLLTDPIWSERASPFRFAGPRRCNAPGIAFADLPPIDLVLVSHNHYDHLDLATLRRLVAMHDPAIVVPLGNDRLVRRAAPTARVKALDWHETARLSEHTVVHLEPAHHWSARGTRDRRMALWGSFAIETAAGRVYFAGDTGFHDGRNYRKLGEKHGGFRFAILPIGAYAPRWFMRPQHQDPAEAVAALQLCRGSFAAGCHWGTFQLTDEPITEPPEKLAAALAASGVAADRFRALLPGEAWEVPGSG